MSYSKEKTCCACRLVDNTIKIEINKVKFLIWEKIETSLLMLTAF